MCKLYKHSARPTAVGFYEDPDKGWIEGTAILVAVQIVAVVTAINDYEKERQFRKLNAVKDEIDVKVVRVNILNQRSKSKRNRMVRGRSGSTAAMKKAIVTLAEGESIELV